MLQLIFLMLLATQTSGNKVPSEIPWKWPDQPPTILLYLMEKPVGYEVQLARMTDWKPGRSIQVRVFRAGKKIHQWNTHTEGAFVFVGSKIIYSNFESAASGCELIAFDLDSEKELWRTHLKGLGPIAHSEYWNQIYLEHSNGRVVVFGNEARGQYIEAVDPDTGKTISNQTGKAKDGKFGSE